MKKTLPILLTTLLLFLFSCTSLQKPVHVPIFQPPAFSFVTVDANNTDKDYIERMEKYDLIMSKSPIPVYVMDVNTFSKYFPMKGIVIEIKPEDPNDPNSVEILDIKVVEYNILGMFLYNQKNKEWPRSFIFINNSLTPEQIIATYAHEIGHYKHKEKGCVCMSGLFPIMSEEHAFLNELEVGWEYDDPEMLETAVRIMGTYAVEKGTSSTYKLAVFNVMQTELFKKTMAYLIILEGINK